MNIGAYITRLVEAGCNALIAAEVAAEIFVAGVLAGPERDAQRFAQRGETDLSMSPEAVRSRRWRQKHKQNQGKAKANDVANSCAEPIAEERDAQRFAQRAPCNLSSISLEVATEEGSKKEVNTRARGTRLPPDATLSPEGRAYAESKRLRNIDDAWAEFVDYWVNIPGTRGMKLNWPATWRSRVRDIAPGGKYAKPESTSVIAAADKLVDRIRGFDAPPPNDPGTCSGAGQTPLRLLPEG